MNIVDKYFDSRKEAIIKQIAKNIRKAPLVPLNPELETVTVHTTIATNLSDPVDLPPLRTTYRWYYTWT